MSAILTMHEREERAQRIYKEYLSECVYRDHLARELMKRLGAIDTTAKVLVAVTTPGALLSGIGWLTPIAIAASSITLLLTIPDKLKRIQDARQKLIELRNCADNLLIRLEFDKNLTMEDVGDAVSAMQVKDAELDRFEDAAFLLLTKGLRRKAEEMATQELQRRGYTSVPAPTVAVTAQEQPRARLSTPPATGLPAPPVSAPLPALPTVDQAQSMAQNVPPPKPEGTDQ